MPINYKKYPPTWQEIRQRILERAGNKCECCGLENKQLVASYKDNKGKTVWSATHDAPEFMYDKLVTVVLTIAHLDHDEENHEVQDDRLKAMCQLCHLRYDIEEKKKRRKLKQ